MLLMVKFSTERKNDLPKNMVHHLRNINHNSY